MKKKPKFIDYQDYMLSKKWKRFRDSLLRGVRCVGCKSCLAEVIHHAFYGRLKEELPEDVIPLCHSCHGLLHEHLMESYPKTQVGLAVQFTYDVWPNVFSAVPLDESLKRIGWARRVRAAHKHKSPKSKVNAQQDLQS